MTPRVRRYVEEACQRFDATPERVLSRSHEPGPARARWYVMRRLRDDGFSVMQIGRWLDRDHSTVVYGLRRAGQIAASHNSV